MSQKYKKRLSKRVFANVFILIIFVTGLSFTSYVKASDTDVVITSFETNPSRVLKNEQFTLTMKIKNESGDKLDFLNIRFIGNESFFPIGTGSIMRVKSNVEEDAEDSFSFNLKYTGGDDVKVPVEFTYKTQNSTDTLTCSDYVSINVDKTNTASLSSTPKFEPKIIFSDSISAPVGRAGEEIGLILPIKNISKFSAYDVIVTPSFDSDSPFAVKTISSTKTIALVKPNETKDITLDMRIDESAKEKSYSVKFTLNFNNENGDSFAIDQYANITVKNNIKPCRVIISGVSATPEFIKPGEQTTLEVKLYNPGDLDANNIRVSLSGLKSDGLSTTDLTDLKYIDNLKSKKEYAIKYNIFASEKATVGVQNMGIKIEYSDRNNAVYTQDGQINLVISKLVNQNSREVIELDLKNIRLPRGKIKNGDTFSMFFDIANVGSTEISNINITSKSDKEILPVSLDSVLIPVLSPSGIKTVRFQYKVLNDAATRNYPIAMGLEYDVNINSEKITRAASQYMAINVENISKTKLSKTKSNLVIGKITIPEQAYIGQPIIIPVNFYNMGKEVIRNLFVKATGDFDVKQAEFFVGSFESGKTTTYEMAITPLRQGHLKGIIDITYEDSFGRSNNKDIDFGVEGIEAPDVQELDEQQNSEDNLGKKNGLISYKLIYWTAGCLASAIALLLVFRKIHYERMEKMLRELD